MNKRNFKDMNKKENNKFFIFISSSVNCFYVQYFSWNGLLRPNEYHYFSFIIFSFLLSRYLLIISACLCFLSFDHAVPFRFSLFSTRTLIFFRIILYPGSFCLLFLTFPFPLSSVLHILLGSCIHGFCQSLPRSILTMCQ